MNYRILVLMFISGISFASERSNEVRMSQKEFDITYKKVELALRLAEVNSTLASRSHKPYIDKSVAIASDVINTNFPRLMKARIVPSCSEESVINND